MQTQEKTQPQEQQTPGLYLFDFDKTLTLLLDKDEYKEFVAAVNATIDEIRSKNSSIFLDRDKWLGDYTFQNARNLDGLHLHDLVNSVLGITDEGSDENIKKINTFLDVFFAKYNLKKKINKSEYGKLSGSFAELLKQEKKIAIVTMNQFPTAIKRYLKEMLGIKQDLSFLTDTKERKSLENYAMEKSEIIKNYNELLDKLTTSAFDNVDKFSDIGSRIGEISSLASLETEVLVENIKPTFMSWLKKNEYIAPEDGETLSETVIAKFKEVINTKMKQDIDKINTESLTLIKEAKIQPGKSTSETIPILIGDPIKNDKNPLIALIKLLSGDWKKCLLYDDDQAHIDNAIKKFGPTGVEGIWVQDRKYITNPSSKLLSEPSAPTISIPISSSPTAIETTANAAVNPETPPQIGDEKEFAKIQQAILGGATIAFAGLGIGILLAVPLMGVSLVGIPLIVVGILAVAAAAAYVTYTKIRKTEALTGSGSGGKTSETTPLLSPQPPSPGVVVSNAIKSASRQQPEPNARIKTGSRA